MNRSNIAIAVVAAALSLGASASFAQGNNYQTYPDVPTKSVLTRAEVKAELAQAAAKGQLSLNEQDYPQQGTPGSDVRGQQVKTAVAGLGVQNLRTGA